VVEAEESAAGGEAQGSPPEETDIRRDVFYALSAAKIPILMMRSLDMSLEEIFLNLTTNETTGEVK
jgi:ABC-2 type transport system ATP-binding protein